jgi:Na+-driven multidrug efflux pump
MLGAYLLARNSPETTISAIKLARWNLRFPMPASKYGWALFGASNIGWIAFGILTSSWGLVTTQIVFAYTSALGIRNWILNRQPA